MNKPRFLAGENQQSPTDFAPAEDLAYPIFYFAHYPFKLHNRCIILYTEKNLPKVLALCIADQSRNQVSRF